MLHSHKVQPMRMGLNHHNGIHINVIAIIGLQNTCLLYIIFFDDKEIFMLKRIIIILCFILILFHNHALFN